MAKYNPFDPANGYSEEDRLALNGKCASLINQAYKNPFPGTKIRLDGADNAGIFFAKQLAHVKTKAYDKEFPELSGLKIFPQTSETDEGAAYIEYYSYEPVGFADVIANYASDLPRVDVKGTPHRAEIVNIGDSYGYNVQELRACRRNAVLGIMKSLDSARAEAARRVYDVKVNHLIWHGDEKTGMPRGENTEPGDIIALDTSSQTERYIKATNLSNRIAGVHTDEYAMLIGGNKVEEGQDFLARNLPLFIPVSLAGRVHAKVVGPVHTGDYIVLSSTPGVGRAVGSCEAYPANKIVGYACEGDDRTDMRLIKVRVGGV